MKRLQLFILLICAAALSCSSPVTRKVLIAGRGSIKANGNDITMKDGSGYAEETVDVNGDEPVTWNVQTPTGKTTVSIPGAKGFYILNLKTDTLAGSQQNIGKDLGGRTISQEELKVIIDSLTKLTTGTNVSEAAKNYSIPPNQIVKVTEDIQAKVYGPFTKVPGSIEVDKNGKVPEIYKFYTNAELRELIVNLKKQSI